MSSPTQTKLPIKPRRSSNPCPKCPHRLSEYASGHIQQPSPTLIPLPPSPKTTTKIIDPRKPALTEFPTPRFSSLQNTNIDIHRDQPIKGDYVTLRDLLKATTRALIDLEENSAPAINEDEEEDHAEREWNKVCTLKELESSLEEMIGVEGDDVSAPKDESSRDWSHDRNLKFLDGGFETISGGEKSNVEKEKSPNSRKGILRSRSNSSENIVPVMGKKKSVRFDEENQDDTSSSDKLAVKNEKATRFEAEAKQVEERVVKKRKSVSFV